MADLPWEDNLLERKVESDLKDLLATFVAFSNSVRPEHVAVVLIGERDDGTIQGVSDPDRIQKTVRKECDKIYPPILWKSEVYKKEGKYCVRVEIQYDGETPHFGGQSWVRKGSENIRASDEVFQRLIDLRTDIVHELGKWIGKGITVRMRKPTGTLYGPEYKIINSVNSFYVTFEDRKKAKTSTPVNRVSLSYDHVEDRLMVITGSS